MKDVVVIGLGNPLMSDEGAGIRVVQELIAESASHPGVEFIDAGASAMRVVHAIAGRRKAIIIDCARMGESPGVMRRFTPEDVMSVKKLSGLSLHEGDLLQALELSRRLGECPAEVVIFGIEPESIGPGQSLSPQLDKNLEKYLEAVGKELAASRR